MEHAPIADSTGFCPVGRSVSRRPVLFRIALARWKTRKFARCQNRRETPPGRWRDRARHRPGHSGCVASPTGLGNQLHVQAMTQRERLGNATPSWSDTHDAA